MDNSPKGFSVHLATIPRRFPGPPQIATIGWVPVKSQHIINGRFASWNFSFIISGRGSYCVNGNSVPVQAPMVLTQQPGCLYQYGAETTWSEMFFIYDQANAAQLQSSHLTSDGRTSWRMDPSVMQNFFEPILRICQLPVIDQEIDRLDRLCEFMVMESIYSATEAVDEQELEVRAIRAHLEQHYREPIEINDLVREAGFSDSQFRRLWAQQVDLPPARYVIALRLRQACRELVETNASIQQIAKGLGFSDQLYFARCFKRFSGETASAYRSRHREGTGLALLKGPAKTLP